MWNIYTCQEWEFKLVISNINQALKYRASNPSVVFFIPILITAINAVSRTDGYRLFKLKLK